MRQRNRYTLVDYPVQGDRYREPVIVEEGGSYRAFCVVCNQVTNAYTIVEPAIAAFDRTHRVTCTAKPVAMTVPQQIMLGCLLRGDNALIPTIDDTGYASAAVFELLGQIEDMVPRLNLLGFYVRTSDRTIGGKPSVEYTVKQWPYGMPPL